MEVKSFSLIDHYEIISDWWTGHDWTVLPQQVLPHNGLIVYDDNTPICAGFLYKTDSAICWLEWVISNPLAKKEQRSEALNALIDCLVGLAKTMGFSIIFTSIKHPGLIKRMEQIGFQVNDNGMTNMSLIFKGEN